MQTRIEFVLQNTICRKNLHICMWRWKWYLSDRKWNNTDNLNTTVCKLRKEKGFSLI